MTKEDCITIHKTILMALLTSLLFSCGNQLTLKRFDGLKTGYFYDSAVKGMTFQTASHSGETAADGSFQYRDGETITFSIGGVVIGRTTGTPTVTPLTLADTTTVNAKVQKMLVLFQSLDADGDPSNGIDVTSKARTLRNRVRGEINWSSNDHLTIISDAGATAVDENDALDHFNTTLATLANSNQSSSTIAVSGLAAGYTDYCYPMTITLLDTDSNLVTPTEDVTINLSDNGAGSFYENGTDCSTPITSTTFSASTASHKVLYKASSAASEVLSFSSDFYDSAQHALIVQTKGAAGDSDLSVTETDFNSNGLKNIGKFIQVESSGKIIVSGITYYSSYYYGLVSRYNSDGTLDDTFAGNGKLSLNFAAAPISGAYTNHWVTGAFSQADGKMIIGGYLKNTSNIWSCYFARVNSDGSMDTSFGTNGAVITLAGGTNCQSNMMAKLSDGKYIGAGMAKYDGSNWELAIIKYNSDGTLDTNFGTNGIAKARPTTNNRTVSVQEQSDGKIVLFGKTLSSGTDFMVTRFNSDGSLDDGTASDSTPDDGAFGSAGAAIWDSSESGYAQVTGGTLQPDGKMLITGYLRGSPYLYNVIVRFNSDGTLDTDFAGDGSLQYGSSSADDHETASVLANPDGTISLIGMYNDVQVHQQKFMIVNRISNNGTVDQYYTKSFGVSEKVHDHPLGATLMDDGRILVVGRNSNTTNGTGVDDYSFARFWQ